MSKDEYFGKPSGPPPNYNNQPQSQQPQQSYVPQSQPNYSQQTQDRGMFSGGGGGHGHYQQQQGYKQ
ncbi:hypothetical protein MEK_04339 [Candida albicans 12C]|nr:hypothetical protein MEK_04339 [Candida albicans 12C]